MTDGADPEHVLSVWKEIVDVAVTGPTPLATGDGSAPELDEFSRPWGPRALGDLYRANGPVQLDDLIDKLITDYHGSAADEMLTVLAGVAVRTGPAGRDRSRRGLGHRARPRRHQDRPGGSRGERHGR